MKTFLEFSTLPKAATYMRAWRNAVGAILDELTKRSQPVEILDPDSLDPATRSAAEAGVPARFVLNGPLAGEQLFLVSASDSVFLAQLFLGQSLDSSIPPSEEHRNAVGELLRRIAAKAALLLADEWKAPVELSFVSGGALSWSPAARVAFRIFVSEEASAYVLLGFQQELLGAFEQSEAPHEVAPDDSNSAASTETHNRETSAGSNLDLLLDVELEASIRFGQRELLLRDVLGFRSGTVVELEHQVDEPAELLVAGRLVARGEVVVVEGNYGLRITEILGPRERYNTLGGRF